MNSKRLKQDAEIVYNYLSRKAEGLEAHLVDACRQADEPTALSVLAELLDVAHIKRVSSRLVDRLPEIPTVATYMMSSLTIQEACAILTKTDDEDLRFATGLAIAPMEYAITRFLGFELKRKSAVFAEGEQEAVARLMIGLHHADHKLFMTWHSHPGSGAESTQPSPVDLDFHTRLESGNYPVIGGIVNRQGYVRFFSHKRPFKISIYGKGVEVIDERYNIYKLGKISAI